MSIHDIFKPLILFAILAGVFIIFTAFDGTRVVSSVAQSGVGCPVEIVEEVVHGISLEPLIHNGQTVELHKGYYDCNDVGREDIVIYQLVEGEVPLIKIVKGIPGDSLLLQKTSDGYGWYILINGEILHNSIRQPYIIEGNRYSMLSLYVKDYNGVIHPGAYLLLGNRPRGSKDSTTFGLVGHGGLIGRAF